ncbi:MAG: hypothetical protein AB7S99_17610 [Pseudodonghicola sp.]
MHSPTDTRLLCDRQAGTDAPTRGELWTILADAGLWPGLSVDAVIDRIETEARIWR